MNPNWKRPGSWPALWSADQDAILRAHYVDRGAAHCAELVGKSVPSVYHRAERLRILRNRLWTPADDEKLRMHWAELTLPAVAKLLGRSTAATYWRAQKIGLSLGCPDGLVYLSQAAQRCGFTTTQFRKILAWAGVRIRRAASRATTVVRGTHCVDPYDAEDAVRQWLKTEPVEVAARARGVCGESLRSWLEDAHRAGKDVPRKPARKGTWRVKSTVIDAIVAERRSKTPVRQAAARLGVTGPTLAGWLRAIGLPRGTERTWRVSQRQVDEAVRWAERVGRKKRAHPHRRVA